ncbi:MAG: DUF4194 domain-containing protein [Pirellulales bacterium]|nr:DUF4194 domain-containing protein [Pirellulales bacterium]
MTDYRDTSPEMYPWSLAAVRLLQGVVYAEEEKVWNLVLGSKSPLQSYFSQLGLLLIVDESEGFAFLRQFEEDEYPAGQAALPKLFRRVPMNYGATLLCVLLRDLLRQFEEEEVDNERCLVETTKLLADWKNFFPIDQDEVQKQKELRSALRKLEDLKLVRKFGDEPETWEVRRILKARLPAAELETLKLKLLAATQGNPTNSPSQNHD